MTRIPIAVSTPSPSTSPPNWSRVKSGKASKGFTDYRPGFGTVVSRPKVAARMRMKPNQTDHQSSARSKVESVPL